MFRYVIDFVAFYSSCTISTLHNNNFRDETGKALAYEEEEVHLSLWKTFYISEMENETRARTASHF